MNPEVAQLLAIIDQAYNKPSWHGTNLRGSVRRVTAAQAAWRASAGRHNIWEIVVHAAYWKYAVARRFTGHARGSFPLKGSNWFRRPSTEAAGGSSATAWKADLDLMDDMHASLRDVVMRLTAGSSLGPRQEKKSATSPFCQASPPTTSTMPGRFSCSSA